MEDNQKDKIIQDYKSKQHLYLEFAILIRNLLETFLRSEDFKFQIFDRVKDLNKLAEKVDKKNEEGRKYNRLNDVEDLAGVRIVFYLESDKDRFLKRFKDEFGDCILSGELKYDPKGYRGIHYIFQLNKKRTILVEYQKYAELKCEIQISTILFHAWSEVEHDIIYKPEGNKQLLNILGLGELRESFEKTMIEHLQVATYQLDYFNKKYISIKKAGEIFNKDFLSDITLSKSNDELYTILETVGEFYHKKLTETLAIVNAILKKEQLEPQVLHELGDYKVYGKSHVDLILKCLELLTNIRYLATDEVLKLLADLTLHEDTKVKNDALRVLKELTEYDYNVLTKTKLGYTVQRKVLDFVKAWTKQEQLEHFEFVETATNTLLSSSIGGEAWNLNDATQYTLTWYSGAVSPTDFLKRIRRETIDLVYDLYKFTKNLEQKLKLVRILNESTHGPINPDHYKNVSSMLSEDKEYIVDVYQKIIFDKQGTNVIAPLGIIAEIEERIYWLNKNDEKKNDKLEKLRARILENEQYHLFHLLAGHLLAYADGEDWREAEKIRNKEIDQLVESIDEKELDVWFQRIDTIASQRDLVEMGEFHSFNSFLFRLAKTHPQEASYLLDRSLDENSPLLLFAEYILRGFREGLHFVQWDTYEKRIVSSHHIDLINKLLFSLNLYDEVDLVEFIREQDIILLENITKKQGKFSFLKSVANREFHYALFNALLRNFKRSPARMSQLIKEKLAMAPDYLEIYFRELPFAIHRKWVEISAFQPETIEVIKEKLIEVLDIDWHVQEFMLEIGKQYGLRFITDVFSQRIRRSAQKKDSNLWKTSKRYEAVPYDLNNELCLFIVKHPEYIKIANEWVSEMTVKWSTYNLRITHLLQTLGDKFEEIVLSTIRRGDKNNLVKVSHLLRQFEGSNFDLCIELVRKTQDKRILGQVKSGMYATGVVSGEYGLAEAFEQKAKALEKYKNDQDKNVRDFANQMIKSFLIQAKQERQRTDEDQQLRKVEFES